MWQLHVCIAAGRAKYYHTELAMLSHIKLSGAFVCEEQQHKSGVMGQLCIVFVFKERSQL